jgi:hypothetical protein
MTKVASLTKRKAILISLHLLGALVLATVALAPKAALAHEGDGVCSDASLKGTIAFSCSGTVGITSTSTGVPAAGVGVFTFDGKGGGSGTQTVVADGAIFVGPLAPFTGTYAVNPDCTASATFSPAGAPMTHFDIAIFRTGFFGVETDAGTVVSCVQNKQ